MRECWTGQRRRRSSVQASTTSISALMRSWLLACESERQHVVIPVRNKALSQLDEYNVW